VRVAHLGHVWTNKAFQVCFEMRSSAVNMKSILIGGET